MAYKWLLTVMSLNVVVPSSILKTKAKKLAEKINIKGFQAPHCWLDRHAIFVIPQSADKRIGFGR